MITVGLGNGDARLMGPFITRLAGVWLGRIIMRFSRRRQGSAQGASKLRPDAEQRAVIVDDWQAAEAAIQHRIRGFPYSRSRPDHDRIGTRWIARSASQISLLAPRLLAGRSGHVDALQARHLT